MLSMDTILEIKLECELIMFSYMYEEPTFERLQAVRNDIQDIVAGYFACKSIEQWHVDCNRDNNTQKEIDSGRIRVRVYIWLDKNKLPYQFEVVMPFQFKGWFNNA